MTHHQNTERSLQSLAEESIRLGRELEEEAHAVYAGGGAADFGFVARSLRRLAARNPFEDHDDASFEALRGILEADLASEICGKERRFFETHYDAMGQHGEVREIPIYTERGELLLQVQKLLLAFIGTRAAALDAIAAETAVQRLLQA